MPSAIHRLFARAFGRSPVELSSTATELGDFPRSPAGLPPPLQVFVSYSKTDLTHCKSLRAALRAWERDRHVTIWSDEKLRAGEIWSEELHDQAEKAHVFLLLITNEFIDSDYCYKVELPIAVDRYYRKRAAVVPIIVKDSIWRTKLLSRFNAVPPGAEPVLRTDSPIDQARGWKAVCLGLKPVLADLFTGTYTWKDRPPREERVPAGLPFLCGRGQQEGDFRTALNNAPAGMPFLCILFGDERQCHQEFAERLEAQAVPEIPRLTSHQAVRHLKPDLSTIRRASPEPAALFHQLLGAALELAGEPSPQTIRDSLAEHKGLTVVQWTLTAGSWDQRAGRALDDFKSFWQDMQNDANLSRLLIFLCIVDQASSSRDVAGDLRKAAGEFEEGPNLIKLDLPSITRTDVDEWLADPRVNPWVEPALIARDLPVMFQRRSALTMREFADDIYPMMENWRL